MRRFSRSAALLALLALLLSLCGCSASGGIEQYFSLPQPAEEYLQLQQLIEQEIAAGSEYAAPVSGSYRQSVQLTDLDGDGADEALVFLRDASRNLKINIYYAVGKEYRQVLSVEGEGRAIGSIDFADMDCDGHTDLLVAWQIAPGMNLLSVYSLRNWTGELLLSTDSSEFLTGDLNSDGREDLLVIRGEHGFLGCGYINLDACEKFGDAAAIVTGVSSCAEMLTAEVKKVSTAAAARGVTVGMTGAEALKLL